MRPYALPSLRELAARIPLERALFDRTPRADRAIIAGVEHVRVLRQGEMQLVPVFEVRSLGLGRRDTVIEDAARLGGGIL